MLKPNQLMWEYLARNMKAYGNIFSSMKTVSLRKLAPWRNVSKNRCLYRGPLKTGMDCDTVIYLSVKPWKMLILAIKRGWKPASEKSGI